MQYVNKLEKTCDQIANKWLGKDTTWEKTCCILCFLCQKLLGLLW
jgi:dissimilatory sulfite reductase (desulfoviridin) alpha/beta subunit